MSLWKNLKEAFTKSAKESTVQSITRKGLDMEALKEIAKINEKYIEIVLKDGTMIKIWRDGDRQDIKPDPTIW